MTLLSISGAALVLAACGSPSIGVSSDADIYPGLIGASYPACEVQGQSLAVYLDTGHPTTDDLNWGSQRERALSLSGQKQAVFIRQTADKYIQNCDESQAQAAANSASASAAAAAAASAEASASAAAASAAAAAAAQQQLITNYLQPACSKIGGTFDASFMTCNKVPYYGTDGSRYYDQLDTSGKSLVTDSSHAVGTSATPSECAAGYYPDASSGNPRGTPGHYAYGICLTTW